MKRLLLLPFAILLLQGCVLGTKGTNGVLVFYNQTIVPGIVDMDDNLEAPVATGGNIDILVKDANTLKPVNIAQVKIQPNYMKVLDKKDGVIRLKAIKSGHVTMDVVTDDGKEDRVTIEIADPVEQTIEPRPWEDLPTPSIFDKGLAVTPSSSVWLFGWEADAKGRTLTGYGAAQWSVSGDAFTTMQVNDSDYLQLLAMKPGEADVSFGNAQYHLVVETEDKATKMVLYDVFSAKDATEGLTIESGSLSIVYVALYDQEGRLIVGDLEKDVHIEDSAPYTVKCSQAKDDNDGNKVIDPRFMLLQCKKDNGKADITVSYKAFTGKITVTCVPKKDDNEEGSGGANHNS